jgi:cytidine deaminase
LSDSEENGNRKAENARDWAGDRRRGERRSGGERRTSKAQHGSERRTGRDRRTGKDRRSEAGWRAVAIDPLPSNTINTQAAESLLAAAIDARSRARAEFSHFQVGAALETAAGEVITGCNVENATYGLTMCAERVALYKALSDGKAQFARIVVVADTAEPTPPCGACRQLLWEFCGDIEIVLANLSGVQGRFKLSALLPLPFDRRLLGG